MGVHSVIYNNSLFQNITSPCILWEKLIAQSPRKTSRYSVTTAPTGRKKIVLCNTFYLIREWHHISALFAVHQHLFMKRVTTISICISVKMQTASTIFEGIWWREKLNFLIVVINAAVEPSEVKHCGSNKQGHVLHSALPCLDPQHLGPLCSHKDVRGLYIP